jgi:hypothetical protein
MQQLLHDPKLAKLDLSSLTSVGSGAAYLPDGLRRAFQRKASKISLFAEGSDLSCRHWLVLMAILQDMGCLNVYDSFADSLSFQGTK